MSNKVKLRSSDDEIFEVEEVVAFESQTLKNIIEDTGSDQVIRLPNVTSKILAKVIEYVKYHVVPTQEAGPTQEEIQSWDLEFVKFDQGTLFELILAANYLNITSLLNLTCNSVAHTIQEKSLEEIRKLFNIKNDFTPEEEREVRENRYISMRPCCTPLEKTEVRENQLGFQSSWDDHDEELSWQCHAVSDWD